MIKRESGERYRIDAVLGPSGEQSSLRQNKLPQQVRDLLAHCFDAGISANDLLPVPMNAAEVRIEGALNSILFGEGGFLRHGGSDLSHYFRHLYDEAWAVVYANDCDGDAERGRAVLTALATQHGAEFSDV